MSINHLFVLKFLFLLQDSEAAEGTPQWKKESFGSKARVEALLANCPRIKASCEAVRSNAGIKAWLETRGPQGF